jgi:DNA-binding protein Fis
MLNIVVNQQSYRIRAAAPDMVAAVALMLNGSGGDKTGGSVPANQWLKGVIYVFGTTEPCDAGTIVVQKIEEASKTLNIVTAIHHEIALVRDEHRALKTATARLEQMQSEKLFAFTDKIDAPSFRILCAILTQGNVAKACRALNIKDSTLRKRMAGWARRGPAYQVLSELVRWRKAMGAKGTVPLNDAITKGTAAPVDFAGLLSDVLDELLDMNVANWEEKAESLAALLRPYVSR